MSLCVDCVRVFMTLLLPFQQRSPAGARRKTNWREVKASSSDDSAPIDAVGHTVRLFSQPTRRRS